ncbi:MAG: hypothetical protein HN444_01350 [Euryarchaeota archaeon]|jgi:hypothetical protein|nr:hypothetical protein [Euryarchaeota archaeon]MBT5122617.1 hypothetical protein [Euryarchaeota archaeon]
MNSRLDRLLAEPQPKLLRSRRKTLKFLLRAYHAGVPGLMAKPSTDLLAHSGGYAFHIGCPNPELRTIASWILTSGEGMQRRIARLIPALWKRHGQEDLALVGLLLANMSESELEEDPWLAFIHLLGDQEPLGALLEIAEEMIRGGHAVPGDMWLIDMASQSSLWHQVAVLFLSLRKEPLSEARGLVATAPAGGDLFERIRTRLLAQEH